MAERAGAGNDHGIFRMGESRIADSSGRKNIAIGNQDFTSVMDEALFVDKSLLIRELVDSGSTATLFCRPRRFGKSLAMSMLKAFFELVPDDDSCAPLFDGLAIWDEDGGSYRRHHGVYPVISISLSMAKAEVANPQNDGAEGWARAYGMLCNLVSNEYIRHDYLLQSMALSDAQKAYFRRVELKEAGEDEVYSSLQSLALFLYNHHQRPCVILVDEYDAPVLAGRSNGYYRQAIGFLKTWLTGALKEGGQSVWRACLAGVQRVTGESLFSDLNNLRVDTPLSSGFSEYFGFTQSDVRALAAYLGHGDKTDELSEWYDGYRFGSDGIYNPWSVLNYFAADCEPGAYWLNTSMNTVLGEALANAGPDVKREVLGLVEPGARTVQPLVLSRAFAEVETDSDSFWGMLYLSGYLTTDDTFEPASEGVYRSLRVPNREVRSVYSREVGRLFGKTWGQMAIRSWWASLESGTAEDVQDDIEAFLKHVPSYFDLVSERDYHLLLLGAVADMAGYVVASNREHGDGRPDIRIESMGTGTKMERGSGVRLDPDGHHTASSSFFSEHPVITLELKHLAGNDAARELDGNPKLLKSTLEALAQEALEQIVSRGYDAADLGAGRPCVRWGLAFSGKHVAVTGGRVR